VELRVVGDSLYGAVWNGYVKTHSELVAHVDREPEVGVVAYLLSPKTKFEQLKWSSDPNSNSIRFLLGKKECQFDGSQFRFISP
jgi:hypothetical protein